jgi:hypothetical protein
MSGRPDNLTVVNRPVSLARASASLVLVLASCRPKPPADASDVPHTVTSMVSASAVISACPDARKMNAKAAADTINKLVEPCAQVPGGKAHFSATLMPSGKIELASPDANVAEGVVPTCVLSYGLTHKVHVTQPCTFDVQLEERKLGAARP